MCKTIAAALLTFGLAACGSTPTPIPQGPAVDGTTSAPASAATVATVSTCDAVREAILTGTPAQVAKAMKALVADKSADATAREYARYYLGRDAKSPDLREMDVTLIQSSCG